MSLPSFTRLMRMLLPPAGPKPFHGWVVRLGGAFLVLFAIWQGSTVKFAAEMESEVPRTVHVKVGTGKRATTAGTWKVNSNTGTVTQTVPIGWSRPPQITLVFAEKSSPLIIHSATVVTGFGIPLARASASRTPEAISKTNRALRLTVEASWFRAKQWLAAVASAVAAFFIWSWCCWLTARVWRWYAGDHFRTTLGRCLLEERNLRDANPEPLWRGWKSMLALALFPFALIVAGWQLMEARGPVWHAYRDPDYAYLFSSIHLLRGLAPLHTDHPGTPVQMLGALLMGLEYLPKWGAATPVTEILRHAEHHIAVLNWALLLLTAFTAWISGIAVAWACRTLAPGLIMQTGWFVAPISIAYLHRATPELALMATAQLMGTVLVLMAARPGARRSLILAAALGFLGGFIIAVKVTAVPVLIFLAAISGMRRRLMAAGLAAATFFAFTLPVWSRFAKTLEWLLMVGSNTGVYGTGKPGLIDLATSMAGSRSILSNQWLWFLVLASGLVSLGWACVMLRRQHGDRMQDSALMLTLCLSACAGVCLLTFKHPYDRYLVPVAPLAAVVLLISPMMWSRGPGGRGATLLALGLAVLFAVQTGRLVHQERTARDAFLASHMERDAFLDSLPLVRRASHINGPTHEGAILFGRFFTDPEYSDPVYNDAMGGAFPGALWAQHPRLLIADAWGLPFTAWSQNGAPVRLCLIAPDIGGFDVTTLAREAGYQVERLLTKDGVQLLALEPLPKADRQSSAP